MANVLNEQEVCTECNNPFFFEYREKDPDTLCEVCREHRAIMRQLAAEQMAKDYTEELRTDPRYKDRVIWRVP